jgi:GNAT superfamily N-acetyltransferase
MPTVEYHYPRALELEGRHPQDAGIWPVTVHRLEAGEGLPAKHSPWAAVSFGEGEPFPPTTRPPTSDLWWNFYYRRLRSSAECDRHMQLEPLSRPRLAFQITAAWANPPGGVIPQPSDADRLLPDTHAAVFIGRFPERRVFHFALKWKDWGDNGTGYMPYEYFDRYTFECWAIYGRSDVLRLFRPRRLDVDGHVRWSAHDEEDHRVYGFEVQDARFRERRAWAFVVERDGALEIEELYVRPEYRRAGHGRWLADRVAQLAREKGMPLRIWVAFADCRSESAPNYPALVSTARRLGVQFQECPTPWAAYFGTNERPGEPEPVEPVSIPSRPRAPRAAVLAAAVALGTSQPAAIPSVPARAVLQALSDDVQVAVGTAEWNSLTDRRAELIYKKNREGLSDDERAEFERLQRLSRAAIARTFPPPKPTSADPGELERRLGVGEEPPSAS